MTGCFCKAVASGPDVGKIDKPNPVPLPTGAWTSVTTVYPSIVKVISDPGADLIAVPEMEKGSLTEVYTSRGTGVDRVLILPVPGVWRIRNTGATSVIGLVLADPNGIAGLLYGGVYMLNQPFTSGPVSMAPLTMAAPTGVVVGAADTQVLAPNANRRALWVGGADVVAGTLSFAFGGAAAVLGSGLSFSIKAGFWGGGPILICCPPSPAFTGEVRAIGSAAGVKAIAQEAT